MRRILFAVLSLAFLIAALQAVWAGAQSKLQKVIDTPPATSQPVNPVR